ncbi:MAG: tRNA preQ1(34) S-adenosylmethionine ribosyltransferase-isomerase QueA [Clostridia bacterium]|nr:tRNA preQ1(34) S-adenosylmethionine ribosyltransferase-isomerase QueA [Clostridia bacterium]MDQ7792547.1 tRNA preQ1(34) S-adenosylmethionine ribosyltransferase-isomerase QueA [Clostridia bacterium]
MRVAEFDYELPDELIAQEPLPFRDESRLLVIGRHETGLAHRHFRDIPDYLRPGDLLVVNETRVLPVRLFGHKTTDGRVEVLLLRPVVEGRWEALVRPGRRLPEGTRVEFGPELSGKILSRTEAGGRIIEFEYEGRFEEVLERIGHVPLPPYIKRDLPAEERDRYQTVYARHSGSAAAPTAGLHFTPELLEKVKAMGVSVVSVVLHIGLDTFRPVKVENVHEHRMHSEWYSVPKASSRAITETKRVGGRVIAVGTTVTRCLEAAAGEDGTVSPGAASTDIFIYPGYKFKVIDGLVTNFHLPRSTLLMLVSALVGRERLLEAYREAVRMRYRFFSFGDAMLII